MDSAPDAPHQFYLALSILGCGGSGKQACIGGEFPVESFCQLVTLMTLLNLELKKTPFEPLVVNREIDFSFMPLLLIPETLARHKPATVITTQL